MDLLTKAFDKEKAEMNNPELFDHIVQLIGQAVQHASPASRGLATPTPSVALTVGSPMAIQAKSHINKEKDKTLDIDEGSLQIVPESPKPLIEITLNSQEKLNTIDKLAVQLNYNSSDFNQKLSNLLDQTITELQIEYIEKSRQILQDLDTLCIIDNLLIKFGLQKEQLPIILQRLVKKYESCKKSFDLDLYLIESNETLFALTQHIDKVIDHPGLKKILGTFEKKLNILYKDLNRLGGLEDIASSQLNELMNHLPDEETIGVDSNVKHWLKLYGHLTPSLIEKVDEALKSVKKLVKDRLELLEALKNEFASFSSDLGLSLNVENVPIDSITSDSIKFWKEKVQLLEKDVNERKLKRIEVVDRIERLCEILEPVAIPDGIDDAAFEKLNALVEKLEIEKRENIGRVIKKVRDEISRYWTSLLYDDLSKNKFTFFYEDQMSENLLQVHQEYLDKLKAEAKELEPILKMIEDLNQLIIIKKQVENPDPDRFKRPNFSVILAQEEKMRKRIRNELPELINQLKINIEIWEGKSDRLFTVGGVRYLDQVVQIGNTLSRTRSSIPRKRLQLSNKQLTSQQRGVKRSFSALSSVSSTPKSKSIPESRNQTSIIKHRSLSEMTNPFESRTSKRQIISENSVSPTKQGNLTSVGSRSRSGSRQPWVGSRSQSQSQSQSTSRETTPRLDHSQRSKPILSFMDAEKVFKSSNTKLNFQKTVVKGGSPWRKTKVKSLQTQTQEQTQEQTHTLFDSSILGKKQSPALKSLPVLGLGIISKGKTEVEELSDLDCEQDKENFKPFKTELFNLSALDPETF